MSAGLTGGVGAFVEWRRVAAVLAMAAPPLLALPLFVSEFTAHVLAISAYYVILAASWNMLAGFTGQFSLAQHAFAALGAYTSGLLVYHLQTPLWVSIPAGVLTDGRSAAFCWASLVLKMRAIYLSIATWAFAETLRITLSAAYEFTRGDLGLSVPSLYGHVRPVVYYYTFLAVAAALPALHLRDVEITDRLLHARRQGRSDARAVAGRGYHAGEALRLRRLECHGGSRRRALCALCPHPHALDRRLQRDGAHHRHGCDRRIGLVHWRRSSARRRSTRSTPGSPPGASGAWWCSPPSSS